MVRFCLFILLLLPSAARADIFPHLTGSFGYTEAPWESCATNPAFFAFSPDHKKLVVTWASPVLSFTGDRISSFTGTVTEVHADSVTVLRDDESRFAPDGSKVLWTMLATPVGMCWTRADLPADACLLLEHCDEAEPNG